MIDTITKIVPLYLAPVLALTSTLLTLFAYLAPAAMLHTQVALMIISPGRSVPLPGDVKDAVDGPTIRMGAVGETYHSQLYLHISDNFGQVLARNRLTLHRSIALLPRPPPITVRFRLAHPTRTLLTGPFLQICMSFRKIPLLSCMAPRPPPPPGSPCHWCFGACSLSSSACRRSVDD